MAKIAVALDVPKASDAMTIVESLEGLDLVYKVGLELFVSEGPQFVSGLVKRRKSVFLDLKLHDIPNTVVGAVRRAGELGVDYLTLHLSNGRRVFEQVADLKQNHGKALPRILGVSVLTSFDDQVWGELTEAISGTRSDTGRSVQALLAIASSWGPGGIDGIVCSGSEVRDLKRIRPDWLAVIPGIRPKGAAAQDQARIVTPEEACLRGADLLVIGRPITGAASPRAATVSILEAMAGSRPSGQRNKP